MERLQFGKALEFWGMWSYPLTSITPMSALARSSSAYGSLVLSTRLVLQVEPVAWDKRVRLESCATLPHFKQSFA